jgi:cellulose synthase/poly-beta-1,6-N-acetylglucosamine synthase-like glycosyltransferase
MLVVAAALAVGTAMVGLAAAIDERRQRAPRLDRVPPSPLPAPSTLVLLPVRDEAANVGPCLDALLALTGRPPVRVIDDGSTDATARITAGFAAQAPQLTMIAAGPLPEGWRGKVHALTVGARDAAADWLLLTDADVRVQPQALARALAAAQAWRLDAVSLSGHQEARGPAENLLVPAVFALLDWLLGDWQEAAAGGGPPIANGQFLLLRRAAWESCGGFAAIRWEIIDDVATVATLRRHGYRTGFFRAPDLLSVRMYRGVRQVTRGWRRNLGGLLGPRRGVAAATLVVLLLPAAAIVAALAAGRGVAAAILWAAGAVASGLLRTGSGHSPLWALLYPLDSLLLAVVLAAGAIDWRRGRLLSWKGRDLRT